jgi:uncharacterized hydrophobic protein (TIGR00271 family)
LNDTQQDFLGELRIGRQASGRFQILAIPLAVALGLVYLLGAGGVDVLDQMVVVAPLLGVLVVGLTLVNVFELLAGSAERSGSYGLAQETLGGVGGFIGGWSLLAGQVLLTVGLLQVAAAQVSALVPGMPVPVGIIALVLVVVIVLVELFQAIPRRPARATLVAFFLIGLAAAAISVLLRIDYSQSLGSIGQGGDGLAHNLAHYALLFALVEVLLFSRRQIRSTGLRLMAYLGASIALAGLVLGLFGFLQAGLTSVGAAGDLVRDLAAGGSLRLIGGSALAFGVCLTAANSTLMTAARQLSSLSRWGGLPDGLRRLRSPFALPPRLFLLLLLGLIPMVLWLPTGSVVDLAAFMFLVGMLVAVAAAFHSRRTEPDRRRDLRLPLFPLVPLTAIGVDLALLLGLPLQRQLGGLLWLGLGLILYFVFARQHQVTALEGVTTFGREGGIEKPEGVYRILVPLAQGETRHFALSLAAGLARQLKGDVIPLQVIPMPDPLAMEQGRRIAQERNTLFQWSTRLASEAGIPISPVTRLSRSVSEGIVDTAIEESCDLILMPWRVAGDLRSDEMGRVIDPVVSQAPCDVAVVAYRTDQVQAAGGGAAGNSDDAGERKPLELRRILVPTSGGPHAPLAVGLALLLSREYGSEVDSVYVAEPDASPAELQAGEGRIRQTLATVQEKAAQFLNIGPDIRAIDQSRVKPLVVQAEDVVSGITQASEDVDLVFIGSSEQGVIDQVLFGNLPRQVAAASSAPVIMVRRYQGLSRFWLRRAWEALSRTFPTLNAEDQIEVYKRIRRGARPDVDFFVMMALAATIATFGLLQNSGAVIIGAMLVAPLFTPILAFSLAIALGDIRLIRLAIEATLKGVFLAIGLAVLLAYISPMQSDPLAVPEIAARTQPNLFDLIVALASGAAGAYAVARKDVAAALPGVAIAAALVPPLGVIGIGIAQAQFSIAGGGTLLVVTNLIAISLAGSFTLLLLGFRPAQRGERQARLRTGLVASVILLVVISLPLAALLVQAVGRSQTQHTIQSTLQSELAAQPGVSLVQMDIEGSGSDLTVTATVYVPRNHSGPDAAALAASLRQALDKPVHLRLVAVPVIEVDQPAP